MHQPGPSAATNATPSPSEDLKQRERAEALRWRFVFDSSPIGVVLMDIEGRVLATNTAYQRMLGYSESEFENLSLLEITHEDYREHNVALFTELLAGQRDHYQIEKRYRRKDGSLVWVRNSVDQTRGVIEGAAGAAKALGLHPNTLRHRMEKLGIKRGAHRIS